MTSAPIDLITHLKLMLFVYQVQFSHTEPAPQPVEHFDRGPVLPRNIARRK